MELDLLKLENQALSVSDFISQTNGFFERLGSVLIKGEISEAQERNHLYFSIKDAQGLVNCLIYKSNLERLDFKPAIGQSVLVYGKNSIYAKNGSYKLIVSHMALSGLGQIMRQLELLDRRLAQEGVYNQKRRLPDLIENVAVVTSREGRVIDDIYATVMRRNHLVKLYFFDVKVQGPEAPASIVRGLYNAYSNAAALNLDAIIVGRGGGSFEDLLCFSDEQVVRAVAQSPVPIISAVGHHEDAPLCDKSADLRASTPTAAAELITHLTYLDRCHILAELMNNLDNAILRRLDDTERKLEHLNTFLRGDALTMRCQNKSLTIDNCIKRLDHLMENKFKSYLIALQNLSQVLEQKGINERIYKYNARIEQATGALEKVVVRVDRLSYRVTLSERALRDNGAALLARCQAKQAKLDYWTAALDRAMEAKLNGYAVKINQYCHDLDQKGICERLNNYQARMDKSLWTLDAAVNQQAVRLQERLRLAEIGLDNFAKRTLNVIFNNWQMRLYTCIEHLNRVIEHKLGETYQRLYMQQQRLELGPNFTNALPSFFNSKLLHSAPERVHNAEMALLQVVSKLHVYQERLDEGMMALELYHEHKILPELNERKNNLLSLITKLQALNPLYQLERGLSITTKDGMHSIKGEDIMVGDELVSILKGYQIYSKVTGVVPRNLELVDNTEFLD